MSELVPFVCPKHGPVLEAVPGARVEHSCGEECAPEGVSLAEHKRRYQDTRRQRKYRDKRSVKALVREVAVSR